MAIDERSDDTAVDEMRRRRAMVWRRREPGYARTVTGPEALQIQPAFVMRTTAEAVVVRKSILKRRVAQRLLRLRAPASAPRLAAFFGARLIDA